MSVSVHCIKSLCSDVVVGAQRGGRCIPFRIRDFEHAAGCFADTTYTIESRTRRFNKEYLALLCHSNRLRNV